MIRKRLQHDPDQNTPTPFACLVGEWWNERKVELAKTARAQLEHLLEVEYEIPLPEWATLLWMRIRIAYHEQIQYHIDHQVEVPASILRRQKELDAGPLGPLTINIFYGSQTPQEQNAELQDAIDWYKSKQEHKERKAKYVPDEQRERVSKDRSGEAVPEGTVGQDANTG